jgi:hypothetical protein
MVRQCSVLAYIPLLLGLGGLRLSAQEIAPPDVDLLARSILAEIEAVRWQMGRPIESRDPIPVEDVAIRENFRQAMTLWRKVNQLGVELVGGGEAPPVVLAPQDREYTPAHVHQVLSSVSERLQEVREGAGIVGVSGIERVAQTPTYDPGADPSDVFQTIVQCNRQVNRMLERQSQPGDVYQQVQQAIFYASEILVAMDDPNPLPVAPAYEPGVLAGHVYGRLLVVFDRLSASFETLGLNMVSWAGGAYVVDPSLTPSDVFDIATLLLSELEYLHSLVPGARTPFVAEHPGRRWESDVYQQAGLLAVQASSILVSSRENPDLVRSSRMR